MSYINNLRENLSPVPGFEPGSSALYSLVVIEPAYRPGDPGSNPGPGENFSFKLLIK